MKNHTSFNPSYSPNNIEFDRALVEKLSGQGPRYTSYPTADRFSTQFNSQNYADALAQRQIGALHKPLSLYVHIPFCNTICYYCGCNKIITKDTLLVDTYLDYLEKELQLITRIIGKQGLLTQLHFGGGTPTFLNDGQFERLMDVLRHHFCFSRNGEYSIEIDPRKVQQSTIARLIKLGINRISVGIQDFNPVVQNAVNRIQSQEETADVIFAARDAGVKSVSVDLIYGLPHQNVDTFENTLEKVLQLDPDRLALYNYAHLPHLFKPQRRINEQDLPSPTQKLDILQNAVAKLVEQKFIFVGMDHFAKPTDDLAVALLQGRLHRNFQGYSTHSDCDLIGIGVSSIGQVGASFAQNAKDIDSYYQCLDEGRLPTVRGIRLNKDDLLRKSIIQSVMCQFFVYFDVFEELYQIKFAQYFKHELAKLAEFEQLGLLSLDRHSLAILPKGRFLVRNIAMTFDYYFHHDKGTATYSKTI